MNEITEFKKSKRDGVIIDNNMKNYDDVVLFPEKLAEAEEMIAKYGIPEEWAHQLAEKGERHHFWTSGVLLRADGEENTFTLAAKTKVGVSETSYTIYTTAELLSQLIKAHWGQEVKVHIQHTVKKEGQWLYELLEVRDV